MVSSAGAGSSITLAVNPTQLVLVGAAKGAYTVRNPTNNTIALTATVGNYAVKPNGTVVVEPKVPPKLSAKHWLSISPTSLKLKAHANAVLNVTSHPAKHSSPGDHHALVLFSTTPKGTSKVLVRTRIGVMTLVRIKGKIERKLVIGRPSVVKRKHQLQLVLNNRGNINERLLKRHVGVALEQGHRVLEKLWGPPRDILPRSRGVYRFPYRNGLNGKLTAVVTVRPQNGPLEGAFAPPLKPIKKTFQVRF
jgi:hypothetical protein